MVLASTDTLAPLHSAMKLLRLFLTSPWSQYSQIQYGLTLQPKYYVFNVKISISILNQVTLVATTDFKNRPLLADL